MLVDSECRICSKMINITTLCHSSCKDLTLFTYFTRTCSHYLPILKSHVHIICSSCKNVFTLFTHLALTCSCSHYMYLLILLGPVHIIYPSCYMYDPIIHLARTCSHLAWTCYCIIIHSSCKNLFT